MTSLSLSAVSSAFATEAQNTVVKLKTKIRLLVGVSLSLFMVVANASLPDGFYVDHGYTFFNVESVSETVDRKDVDKGFKLHGAIRIFGEAPPNSGIKLALKKDGDLLTQKRILALRDMDIPEPHLAIDSVFTVPGTQNHLDLVNTGTGEYEVDVYYVDGNSNKEYLAHTYTIHVGRVLQNDAIANQLVERPPKYFVSQHQEALSAILTPRGYFRTCGNCAFLQGDMHLYWRSSPPPSAQSQISPEQSLRCTVDGDSIELKNPAHPQAGNMKILDKTQTLEAWENRPRGRSFSVRHLDRNALEYRRGSDYKEDLIFHSNITALPFADMRYPEKTKDSYYVSLAAHPGRWECQWFDQGELLRTFAWEVGSDGKLVPHPEQEEGLTLSPGAILVETMIPDNGAKFDARLVPEAVQAGGFYGWEWESSEMEDLADDLPEKGKPFPVPSAPEFVAEEVKPTAHELQREKWKKEAEEKAAKEEAERKVQQAQMEASDKQANEAEAARIAKLNAEREAAYEQAKKETMAEVAEAMKQVNQSQVDMQTESAGSGSFYLLMRLLLSAALLATGLILAGDMLKSKVSQLAGVVDALSKQAGMIGVVTIGLALLDFLMDLVALRPIVGDGLPQVAALLGGLIAASAVLGKQAVLQKHEAKLAMLQAQGQNIGFACLALGVLHLLIGGAPLV